jgi:hypothetical protein
MHISGNDNPDISKLEYIVHIPVIMTGEMIEEEMD